MSEIDDLRMEIASLKERIAKLENPPVPADPVAGVKQSVNDVADVVGSGKTASGAPPAIDGAVFPAFLVVRIVGTVARVDFLRNLLNLLRFIS